jgi:hypothetical protein
MEQPRKEMKARLLAEYTAILGDILHQADETKR